MTVEQMQGEIKNILFQLMYIDEIVKDLSPSDTLIEDKTITITQEFIEKMKYFAPDDFVRE